MPMISVKIKLPPQNQTVLTRSGAVLIHAAYHLGKWYEVPGGKEMPEPEEWLLLPANEVKDIPKPAKKREDDSDTDSGITGAILTTGLLALESLTEPDTTPTPDPDPPSSGFESGGGDSGGAGATGDW